MAARPKQPHSAIETRLQQPVKASVKADVDRDISPNAIYFVLVLTAIIYSRALTNGFTYMDDDYYILKNYYLRDLSLHGVWAIFTHFYSFNYHPLTTLSNLAEYTLFKLNPLPYHFFNVLLHLLNTWLVYMLAESLSRKRLTAVVVSALFAIHPMHVESVAWVAERKDVLYSAFYLSSALFYLRYIDNGYKKNYYVISLLLFVGSLLSKSAAVTLPVLFVAIDLYRGRKISTAAIMEKVPFLLLSILFGILAIMSQNSGGAINDLSTSYSALTRLFLFTGGLASYVTRAVAPIGLSAIHYFPDTNVTSLPWYYYLSLPFTLLLGWLVTRRSAYRKDVLFGSAFFLITISVMLQVITVGSAIIAERYTYLSYIGLFYIVGQYISALWLTKHRSIVVAAGAFVLVTFSIQSWARIGIWKDSNVLFTDIVEKDPNNWRNCFVYYYWGISHSSENNFTAALEDYSMAIKLKPDYEHAYRGRGLVHDALHDPKAAVADYNAAIAIDPNIAETYSSRGWAYYELGDKRSALNDLNHAIAIDPKCSEAYNSRGWAYYEAGDIKAAMADFDKAILLSPSFAKPYFNRAAIKVNSNDLKGGIDDYTYLISIYPTDSVAYYDRGIALLNMNDPKACDDLKRALELGNRDALKMVQQHCR